MKKIPLKSASQRAIVEALNFYIKNNSNNPKVTQFNLRPFRIAISEMRRGMEDKKEK